MLGRVGGEDDMLCAFDHFCRGDSVGESGGDFEVGVYLGGQGERVVLNFFEFASFECGQIPISPLPGSFWAGDVMDSTRFAGALRPAS